MSKPYAFPSPLLTLDEAADYLRVSKRTIVGYIARGMIHTYRLPSTTEGEYLRRTHIKRSELDKFIKRGMEV